MRQTPLRRRRWRGFAVTAVTLAALQSAVVAVPAVASSSGPAPTGPAVGTSASAPAADPSADAGGRLQNLTFGIRPFLPEGAKPRGSFIFRAQPGQTVHDEVSIFNYADVPLNVEVYATDAITSADGGFGLLGHSAKPTGVGSWVTLLSKSAGLRIQPKVRVDIPFTVVVPDSAGPGDHVGGIVVSLPGRTKDANGNTVRVDSRVSALLSMRVGGEIRPGLAVTGLAGTYDTDWQPWAPGIARVSFSVHNQGNISQGASYVVSLHSPLGVTRTLPAADIRGILPGDAVTVSLAVKDLWPAVHYTATVALRGVPSPGDPIAPPIEAHAGLWALPFPQLIVLLALAVTVVLVVALRRWLRRRRMPVTTAHVTDRAPEPAAVR